MTDTTATFAYADVAPTPEQWQEWLDAGHETLRMTFVTNVGHLLDSVNDIDEMNDEVDDWTGGLYLTDLDYGVDRDATAALWADLPTYTGDGMHDTSLVMWVEGTIEWDIVIEDNDLTDPEA
jgi:hypothetical protein